MHSARRSTQIVVSGDLDEWRIAALRDAPVDRMLVGTALVGGSGAPTAGFVYKLVAVADRPGPDAPLRPVAKSSPDKATRGGCKVAHRRYDTAGRPVAEVLTLVADPRRHGHAGEGRARTCDRSRSSSSRTGPCFPPRRV